MKVNVWDTYVRKNDGTLMHFDILAPIEIVKEETIFQYGDDYLTTKEVQIKSLSTSECRLCHMETAPEEVVTSIQEKGYHIIELQNCD
ncbi:DUF2024 family protein [uncultured Dokdonia sp.]|uniref:DUF2024 family protein n=1 Tax=uncultured Dokdonia sp. TaxID=575653 RepID=UPI0026382014|nr:DUF2024 family protein [uncultured Dokdonia sp.]